MQYVGELSTSIVPKPDTLTRVLSDPICLHGDGGFGLETLSVHPSISNGGLPGVWHDPPIFISTGACIFTHGVMHTCMMRIMKYIMNLSIMPSRMIYRVAYVGSSNITGL